MVAPTRRVTSENPFIVEAPRVGFLNLMGSAAEAILQEDKAAFRSLFSSLEEGQNNPPLCDVLMIYGDFGSDGHITGSVDTLRDLIQESRACIVVVASENTVQSYIAAAKRPGQGRANLIMTLKRKGTAFTNFFVLLFRRMYEGKSMPLAWVELAPQMPSAEHQDCPETIFSAEISHIIFR